MTTEQPTTERPMGKLAAALAKAQGKITAAQKDGINPGFKTAGSQGSKYATLASVWEACRAALSENEIAVTQAPLVMNDRMVMRTRLMHASGEYEDSYCIIPVALNAKAQDYGSAITYIRRYSLAAMVGVAPDDDDDGNAATAAGGQAQPAQPQRSISENWTNDDWEKWLTATSGQIRQAKSVDELDAVVSANALVTNTLSKKMPGNHKRLLDIITERRDNLTALSDLATAIKTPEATEQKKV